MNDYLFYEEDWPLCRYALVATRLTGTRVGIGDEKDILTAYSSGRNSVRL